MVLPLLPAIALTLLLLLAVPVYLPRAGLASSVLIIAGAAFFYWKPQGEKFNWGLDKPIALLLGLYAALWIGTALVSWSRERATVVDQRGLDQVRRAPAV